MKEQWQQQKSSKKISQKAKGYENGNQYKKINIIPGQRL